MAENSKVKVQSSDGETIEVEMKVISLWKTVKTMLEALKVKENAQDKQDVIPLPNVKGTTLQLVVNWSIQHKDDPVPSNGNADQENYEPVDEWDAEFLKIGHGEMLDLLLAADYLDISKLVDAVCKTIAGQMKGKSVEDVRAHFGINPDFAEGEEERIKEEHAWCEKTD